MNSIIVNGEIIEYIIEKRNIKHLYISVINGKIIVKAPILISRTYINKILSSKATWIYKKLRDSRAKMLNKDSNKISILGFEYLVTISYEKLSKSSLVVKDRNIEIRIPIKFKDIIEYSSKIIQKLLNEYFLEVSKKEFYISINNMSNLTGLYPLDYKIRKLKRVWGICSSKKIITLNSKLIEFERPIIDYVVLHEICHLKYMNHSRDFWNLVEKYMPDYKMRKQKLKLLSNN